MQYRHIERAGIDLSRICFGAQRFEYPEDHQRYVDLILYAFGRGINFFDTAEKYCGDQSEYILGEAVQEMKKSGRPFYISSKCMDADHETFRANLERTLRRLNLDCIDFYTPLWGVKSALDWVQAKRFGALRELEAARREGLIRYISITTHMQNTELAQVMDDYPFDLNIIGYNAVNAGFRAEGIASSRRSGAANIAMNPLGTEVMVRYPELFDAIRIREGQTLAEAAYAYLLSKRYGQVSTLMLVLAGVIISSLFSSGISILEYCADPDNELPAIVFWLMGGLSSVTMDSVCRTAPILVACILLLYLVRWHLNIVSLDEEEAVSMGINVKRFRLAAILLSTVVTAVSVAVCGMISFIGIVVPHFSRMVVGTDNKFVVPVSAISGGIFLLLVDTVARNLMASELPLSILTSIIGAPVFAYMLRRTGGVFSD